MLQCSNVGVHDYRTNSLIQAALSEGRNLKPVMLTVKRAGISRYEMPKLAVKYAGYTVTYGPAIRTSTSRRSVTFL